MSANIANPAKFSQFFFWEFLQILTIFSPRFLQILTIFIPAGQAESGISLLLIARCFARSGLPADGKDIEQEDDVHHQGVEDSRDGHLTAVEDERGKGNGNGLGGVLHADFDDNGAADSRREPAKAREQRTAQHSQQDERGRGHSKDSKVVHYLLGVLEKKHQGQEHQGRESGFAENPANLGGGMRPESAEQDAGKDGNEKQDEVLQQELAYGQVDFETGLPGNETGSKFHDERQGEKRDHAADGGQGDRKSHIAFGQHRKDIGRAATRTAGYQHQSHEINRAEMEYPAQAEGDERKENQLPQHSEQHGSRIAGHVGKRLRVQIRSEQEHQQDKNGHL